MRFPIPTSRKNTLSKTTSSGAKSRKTTPAAAKPAANKTAKKPAATAKVAVKKSVAKPMKSAASRATAKPAAKKVAAPAKKSTAKTVQSKAISALEVQSRLITHTLDDNKAEDVVLIDLRDKCSFADRMVVASGRSQRHVASLADHVADALKKSGHPPLSIEGKDGCDWVLIDAGDIVIHIFRPEVRQFYNIEKMWAIAAPVA